MSDHTEKLLQIMTEVRDLLRLMAEPAIAERDKKFRKTLREIAGAATGKKAKAILLMDGTRLRANIVKECGIDSSDMSGLMKKLKAAQLLTDDEKQPKLAISVPTNFFEKDEQSDG